MAYRQVKEKDEIIDVVSEPPVESKKRQRTPKGAAAADEKSGKRLKEDKKQEIQHKSHEEVQREETFKTWLTGLHRRRKVRISNTVFFILSVFCSLTAL